MSENLQMEQEDLPSLVDLNSEFSNLAVSSETSTPKWVIQKAPIFDPALQDSLVEIINMLDPASFAKLVRTCRTMHHFCFTAKGIEVRFGCGSKSSSSLEDGSSMKLDIVVEEDDSKPDGVSLILVKCSSGGEEVSPFSEELIERMLKMPFRFVINHVDVTEEMNTRQLEAIRRYLHRFRRLDVEYFSLYSGTSDWNTVADIIQEFGVLQHASYTHSEVFTPAPTSVLVFLATNLMVFVYPHFVSDDIILATKARVTLFHGARISVYTFKKLLERFLAGEFCRWEIGRQPLMGNNRDRRDPFLSACSEVLKVAQVENVNFIIKDFGVLYWSPNDPWMFHLLRADRTTGRLSIAPDRISFTH